MTSADFDGDGDSDLATANSNSRSVSVLLGTGSGGFGPASAGNVGKPAVVEFRVIRKGRGDLVLSRPERLLVVRLIGHQTPAGAQIHINRR